LHAAKVDGTLEGIWESQEVTDALIKKLQDSDEDVRAAVVRALVELSDDGQSAHSLMMSVI
jgi:HEAT repeat protein